MALITSAGRLPRLSVFTPFFPEVQAISEVYGGVNNRFVNFSLWLAMERAPVLD
jgi:hypothetical protein